MSPRICVSLQQLAVIMPNSFRIARCVYVVDAFIIRETRGTSQSTPDERGKLVVAEASQCTRRVLSNLHGSGPSPQDSTGTRPPQKIPSAN